MAAHTPAAAVPAAPAPAPAPAPAADEAEELVGFLRDRRVDLRLVAVQAVLGLTASGDGRARLRRTAVATALRNLLGDVAPVAEPAVKALVNLAADEVVLEQILRAGVVNALFELLRDDACAFKRPIVMLLANLSQTPEGCDQLLQKGDVGGALMGLHLRRLIQWFVAPLAAAATAHTDDAFEYVANVLQNITQLPEARRILMEPERGILPALLPQLRHRSAVRRRGTAAALRNCLFDLEGAAGAVGVAAGAASPAAAAAAAGALTGDRLLAYVLSPGVGLVTALIFPLAGPDTYLADDRALMPSAWVEKGAHKNREPDAATRRALVECIALLASTRDGRALLRRVRAYPVLKAFHTWLESAAHAQRALADVHAAAAATASDVVPEEARAAAPIDVHAIDDDAEALEVGQLAPDDEATVAVINRIMQQLFRDDEVAHTSEVMAHAARPPTAAPASATASAGAAAPAGMSDHVAAPGTVAEVEAGMRRRGVTVLTTAEAKAKAAAASRGAAADVDEAELAAYKTPMPDWGADSDEEAASAGAGAGLAAAAPAAGAGPSQPAAAVAMDGVD